MLSNISEHLSSISVKPQNNGYYLGPAYLLQFYCYASSGCSFSEVRHGPLGTTELFCHKDVKMLCVQSVL